MPRRFDLCCFWLFGRSGFVMDRHGRLPRSRSDKARGTCRRNGGKESRFQPLGRRPIPKWWKSNGMRTKSKGSKLYVPKSWKKTEPKNSLRLAQFEIPAAKGDKEPVELAIFSFAGGAAGGVQPNIKRWMNQFHAKGRKVKVTTGEGKQGVYVLADIQGTYNMPIGPPIQGKTQPLPDARMLALIIGIRLGEPAGEGDEKKSARSRPFTF